MKDKDRKCAYCEQFFKAVAKDSKYCSPGCKKKDYIRETQEKWINRKPRKPQWKANIQIENKRFRCESSWLKKFNALRG
jgi:uncharacterized Zn-finger protein